MGMGITTELEVFSRGQIIYLLPITYAYIYMPMTGESAIGCLGCLRHLQSRLVCTKLLPARQRRVGGTYNPA